MANASAKGIFFVTPLLHTQCANVLQWSAHSMSMFNIVMCANNANKTAIIRVYINNWQRNANSSNLRKLFLWKPAPCNSKHNTTKRLYLFKRNKVNIFLLFFFRLRPPKSFSDITLKRLIFSHFSKSLCFYSALSLKSSHTGPLTFKATRTKLNIYKCSTLCPTVYAIKIIMCA